MAEEALGVESVITPARKRAPRPRGLLRVFHRDQRGTAVVEFALVAPILFLVLFGIIEFGRLLNAYNQITQLAGQGARAAAVSRNPDGTAVAAPNGQVNSACNGSNTSIQCQLATSYAQTDALNGVHVCIPTLPSGVGQPVTVHVSYQYNFSVGLFGFTHITLNATQTERAEAPPTYAAGNESGTTCT